MATNYFAAGLRKMFGGGTKDASASAGKGLRTTPAAPEDDTDIKSTDDIGTKLKKRNKQLDNVMKDL